MLEAVLLDEQLMKFGKYEAYEVGNIYQALESDNYVINVVAQIIKRCSEDDAKESEIWREINDYLKRNRGNGFWLPWRRRLPSWPAGARC